MGSVHSSSKPVHNCTTERPRFTVRQREIGTEFTGTILRFASVAQKNRNSLWVLLASVGLDLVPLSKIGTHLVNIRVLRCVRLAGFTRV